MFIVIIFSHVWYAYDIISIHWMLIRYVIKKMFCFCYETDLSGICIIYTVQHPTAF